MALVYGGQQGIAACTLASLQCWMGSFHLPMTIVEPIIANKTFIAMDKSSLLSTMSEGLRFRDFFDVVHFNTESQKLGYANISLLEDFLANAPREIILVKMISLKHDNSTKMIPSVICSNEHDCRIHAAKVINLNKVMQLKTHGFHIMRVVTVYYTTVNPPRNEIFSEDKMWNVVFGPFIPANVTVLFTRWYRHYYVKNKHSPGQCVNIESREIKSQFMPSSRILVDARTYEEQFLTSQNSLAVMLRFERMLEFLNRKTSTSRKFNIDLCLGKVLSLSKHLQRIRRYGKPFVTLDTGKFGSNSWMVTQRKRNVTLSPLETKAKSILTALYDNQWTFEEWEESFSIASGGIKNGGYIAALQRTIASRAECLILVGGGTFQDLALKSYIRNHPDRTKWCIHLVCVKDEENVRKSIAIGDSV